jgi:hypothetical protein
MMVRQFTIKGGKLVLVHESPMRLNKNHPDYEKYFGKNARHNGKESGGSDKSARRRPRRRGS